MTFSQDIPSGSTNAYPQANAAADLEAAMPLIRDLMEELDLASLLGADTDASSPRLLIDLKSAISDVVTVCEVLADRSLNSEQLAALSAIEVRAQSLQCNIFDFLRLFEGERC